VSGWLRRNRWFLVALAVLIPVAFVVSLTPRFFPYLETQPQPEAVALGEVVRYAGADIELTDLETLDGDEWNAPQGADLVVATFAIRVVDPPEFTSCEITLVASAKTGYEREWTADSFTDSDYDIPDRFETLCVLHEAGTYDLQLTFLVPRGETADAVVQFSASAALPRVLRLS
jgi:hypothetical protein